MPDVTPRRRKSWDIPSEVPRVIMRWCWGRYETKIPKNIRKENERLRTDGESRLVHSGAGWRSAIAGVVGDDGQKCVGPEGG